MIPIRVTLTSLLAIQLFGQVQKGVNASAASRQLPPLSVPRTLAPGVSFAEVTLPGAKEKAARLWVYLPSPLPAGKLPCVVIAPAGTPLSYGIKVQDGDRPEHLPYVRAGFAVIAYDIDGAFDPQNSAGIRTAIQDFRAAEAGVANARVALNYALDHLGVDPARLYVAGHSSAATLALQVAERDKRVRGTVAYAPVTDIAKHLENQFPALDKLVPGTSAFLKEYSPLSHIESLRCPVFLFHSDLDRTVPVQQTIAFSRELTRVNPRVTLSSGPYGDHYGSMIKDGIPRGIAWLLTAR